MCQCLCFSEDLELHCVISFLLCSRTIWGFWFLRPREHGCMLLWGQHCFHGGRLLFVLRLLSALSDRLPELKQGMPMPRNEDYLEGQNVTSSRPSLTHPARPWSPQCMIGHLSWWDNNFQQEPILSPGDIWQWREAFWLSILGLRRRCYRHLVGRGWEFS